MTTIALSILDNVISIVDGLYSLNDLHKASGNNEKHQPAFFLRNQQTKDLIAEIESEGGNPPSVKVHSANLQSAVKSINGGKYRGTYVCRELVYAYAMWISAKFHLLVIRAFDSMFSQARNTEAEPEMNPHLAIRNAVHAAAHGDRSKYAALYNRLYRHFQVGSYKDITVAQCPAALEYIRSIEGEFIPAAPLQQALIPATKPLVISIPKSAVYQHRFKHQQHLLTLNVFIDGFDVHGNPLRQLFRQLWQAKEEGRPVMIENIEGAVLTHEVIQSLALDYKHALADVGRSARDAADRGCYLPISNPPN